MNNILEELHTDDERQKLSVPAKRLMEKLRPIPSKCDEISRRWFWELMQNASDYNDEVDIILTIEDERITFCHNGNPFSTMDVLNLIAPNSEKDSESESSKGVIGKFGSGLLSTHFLSSHIQVIGFVRSKINEQLNSFVLNLNREKFTDKEWLIGSQQKSRKELESTFDSEIKFIDKEFNTQFIYDLQKPFAEIKIWDYLPNSINYVLDQLPYTLSFMDKVKSVTIKNTSSKITNFNIFSIKRINSENNFIKFLEEFDDKQETIEILNLTCNKTNTSVRLSGNKLIPYPVNTSKLFCGLPLIGSEKFGLPIIFNSLSFIPTDEREVVQLSPLDLNNRQIFADGIKLYANLLEALVKLDCPNIYEIISINTHYWGSEASGIHFKNVINKIVEILKSQAILKSKKGVYLPLSMVKIPFDMYSSKKLSTDLFNRFSKLASSLIPDKTPVEEDIFNWKEAINFSLISEAKYDFISFLEDISKTKQLAGFSLFKQVNTIEWLKSIISLTIEIDDNLFNKYSLLPNELGDIKTKVEEIYCGENLPIELIKISNDISGGIYEDELLHKDFSSFKEILGVNRIRSIAHLCKKIDNSFIERYKGNNGSTIKFVPVLRDLLNWYQKYEEQYINIKELFPWFSEKKAILFLDTFTEKERNAALNIAQSGKLEALSELANTVITAEQIKALCRKASQIDSIMAFLQDRVEDEIFADLNTGNIGEEIVYLDLQKKYPDFQGYQIIWASRDYKEGRYDFEIKKDELSHKFIDVKTTTRGIQNSDTIPFFMKKKQWDFLDTTESLDKYIISRVFLGSEKPKVVYLDIKKH